MNVEKAAAFGTSVLRTAVAAFMILVVVVTILVFLRIDSGTTYIHQSRIDRMNDHLSYINQVYTMEYTTSEQFIIEVEAYYRTRGGRYTTLKDYLNDRYDNVYIELEKYNRGGHGEH